MKLNDHARVLGRWWWLILLATLLSATSSYLAVRAQPYQYRSRTTLLVGTMVENPNPTGNEFYMAQQLSSTYVEIAQRETVRAGVMAALNLSALPAYTVRVLPNTTHRECRGR